MGNSSYIEFYENQNLFKYSGGHMDSYYDKIYTIKNGKFTLLHDGDYGAEDNSHIELDKYGNPIYRYYWNNVEVTKTKYNSLLNSVFDSSKAISVYSKKGYAWNQIRDAINNY